MTLRVTELFYSLQGEGARAGEPSIFIRLSGCSAKHACAASGVVCDTEFESGQEMSLPQIVGWIDQHAPQCKWIVWTGGEPLDQLTADILRYFRGHFKQALETSGVRCLTGEMRDLFDWIVVSPKVAEHILARHFFAREDGVHVDELRYVRQVGQGIPQPSLKAMRYYVSPHAYGEQVDAKNLGHCIELCKQHPEWSVSVQQHKQWRIR